ncbi:MAG: uroporphyrinogen-III synthase [Acinetobacter sp.]|nr:MAG: uroporphyrinogen-III synthase [Acinetobacter sp.]
MATMRIVNTRPRERAAKLSSELIALGYQVQELPLLELCALPLDEILIQQFRALQHADMIVVVSPIAVQLGMQYYQQLGYVSTLLQQKHWIAVGKSTQHMLLQYGIQSVCPVIETSEGMLQLPILQDCRQQTVAFWRGIGGRTLMMQQLQQQGCHILNMLLYTRRQPTTPNDVQEQLAYLPASILLSSEESWNNWLKLAMQYPLLQQQLAQQIYLVLGERVSQVVRDYFSTQATKVTILTLTDLTAQTIHQQLQQYQVHE